MPVKRSSLPLALDSMPIPASPAPLGVTELSFMRDRIADVAPEWAVELDGICSDEAKLVVVPEDGDDEIGPSFVISRENFGFRLDQLHWDMVHEVGIYHDLIDVTAAIQDCLAFSSCFVHALSTTLH